MIYNVLSKKRCVILLVVACFIYFVLNIVVWKMNLIVATIGAICATVAFGLFLYFIRDTIERKRREIKTDIILLGKDVDPEICKRLGGREINGRCIIVDAGVGDDEEVHLRVLKRR